MEPEILDLIRRWLRKFGLLGTLASMAVGIYIEFPVVVSAEQHRLMAAGAALEKSLRQDEQHALQQERRGRLFAAHRR